MISYFKEEIPFFRLIWFFISGIALSIYFNLQFITFWQICWIISLVITLITLSVYKKRKIYYHKLFPGFLLTLLAILSGINLTIQHKQLLKSNHFSKYNSNYLIVRLLDNPKLKKDIGRFSVTVENSVNNKAITNTCGKLLIALRFDTTKKLNLHYGDKLLMIAKFTETEIPYNPVEYNYKKNLSYKQIYHASFIREDQYYKIDSFKGNFIKDFALKFQDKQVLKFRRYLSDIDAQSLASTLILGYKTDLSQQILDAYSKTGTMHVLSVSGMHVAIVVIFLGILLKFMDKRIWTKILKTLIIILFIWFYSLITGLSPSVERAAIMITFVVVGRLVALKINMFNIIAISAFIILVLDPFAVMDIGFQLSFIAVGGLIYLQPKIYSLINVDNKLLDIIWQYSSVSIAAQLATSPISLLYFHQFPLCFIISNLFLVLPATLIMYFGLVFLIVPWPPVVMTILGEALQQIIVFTNKGLFYIEKFPASNISQIWFNNFEITLFYLLIFLLVSNQIKKKLFVKLAIISCFICIVVSITIKQWAHINQKQVTFFSLRKNSATAFLKGKTALVFTDLDSNDFTYKFSVKPYLDSCGVTTIKTFNPQSIEGEHIYHFNKKILRFINTQHLSDNNVKANWLVYSANSINNIDINLDSSKFENLFFDAKNKDYIIKKLEVFAIKNNINYKVLKRNPAIEIKF